MKKRKVSRSCTTAAAGFVAHWYVVIQTATDVYISGLIEGRPGIFQLDVTDLYGTGLNGAAGIAAFFEQCDARVIQRLEALAA